jgi:acetamidase/formamidase
MRHEFALEREVMHGHFSKDLPPVATIDPGDSIAFPTLNARWMLGSGEQPFERRPELDRGHCLFGPVEVRGARAGETLVVTTESIRLQSRGVTFMGDEQIDWEIDQENGTAEGLDGCTIRVAPFAGVLGMPPPEEGIHPTRPPRRWGGNIDCKLLVVGSTLYLPIPVDGALFSAGDVHAAQGDGEVSGTAVETACDEVVLGLDVRRDLELRTPVARTESAWIALGFDADLDTAAEQALDGILDVIQKVFDVRRPQALGLASVAVDLHVSQIVNDVKGVHAVLRDDAVVRAGRKTFA